MFTAIRVIFNLNLVTKIEDKIVILEKHYVIYKIHCLV